MKELQNMAKCGVRRNKNKTPNNQHVSFSLLVFQDTNETIRYFS